MVVGILGQPPADSSATIHPKEIKIACHIRLGAARFTIAQCVCLESIEVPGTAVTVLSEPAIAVRDALVLMAYCSRIAIDLSPEASSEIGHRLCVYSGSRYQSLS